MKRSLFGFAAIAALVGTPALAADMPLKAAPPVPVWSWTGFYIGGQVGEAWSNSAYTLNNGAGVIESFSFSPHAFIGGGHLGIQRQFGGFVLGAEGTLNGTNLNQTDPSVLSPGRLRSLTTNDIATVVGKVGYTWDHWMLYAKGGWADARINTFAINPASGVFGNATNWQGGYTVGTGMDYMVARNWIIGVDFNYYDFHFDRSALATDGTTSTWSNTNSNIYSVMARASYLFNWGP